MTIIGLTGRAGSGKSEAEKVIAAHFSCWVLDLDKIGHTVLKDPFVKERLNTVFGPDIFKDGDVDRKILGPIVFADTEKLKSLNLIVHPFIKMNVQAFIQEHPQDDILISGALLDDIGLIPYCKSVIVIDASDEDIKRFSPRQFEITRFQKTRAEYQDLADYVVFNTFTEAYYDNLRTVLKKCFGT